MGRPKGKKIRQDICLDEFKKILEYIEDDSNMKEMSKDNAIKAFYLLYFFAPRVGEITLWTVKHIKMVVKSRRLTYVQPKKGNYREIPLSAIQVGVLEEVFERELREDDRYSLIRPWGRPMEQYSPASLQRLLNSIIKGALGTDEYYTYSTHSFRAGFASELWRSNTPERVISKLLGHKKSSSIDPYITVGEDGFKP